MAAAANIPGHVRMVGCACYQVQSALKDTIYSVDNVRLQPVRDVLRKCTILVSQLLNSTHLHSQIANLCLEIEPTLLDHPHPASVSADDRLDSELVMLQFLYRLRRVLARGWEQARFLPLSTQLIITDQEWALIEQLLAVLGEINHFNRALCVRTVSLSKVYPHMLMLYRAMTSSQLSCPMSTLPYIATKIWEHDIDDSIIALRQMLGLRIELQFPLVNAQHTLDKWTKVELDKLEPYVLSMAMDPTISSTYAIFRNPLLTDHANNAIIASLKDQEMAWVQHAVGRFHAQYGGRHPGDMSLLATADGYLHQPNENTMYVNVNSSVNPGTIKIPYGAADDVNEEAKDLFGSFAYHFSPFDNPLDPEPARALRGQWEEAGGWAFFQKSPELAWWERHANMYPCLSKLAAIYLAIPATTFGMPKFASPDGPQSLMGCMGYSPNNIEKTLFIRENFHNGLLDVQLSGLQSSRKRKRASKSTGGPGDMNPPMMDIPDHNRQQPPKYLHRLITSAVNLEGEVAWRTKVMKPTGDIELKGPAPNEQDHEMMMHPYMGHSDPHSARLSMTPGSPIPFNAGSMPLSTAMMPQAMMPVVGMNPAAIAVTMGQQNSASLAINPGMMMPNGAGVGQHTMPNIPTLPLMTAVPPTPNSMNTYSKMVELFDAYEWKLGMRHTIRLHLEAVRSFIVNSGYHFRMDTSFKSFEL
jgi:hypothetical protein